MEELRLTDQFPDGHEKPMDEFLKENNLENLVTLQSGERVPLKAIFRMGYNAGWTHGRQSAINDVNQAVAKIGSPNEKWMVLNLAEG